jgi:hypothetical protein
MSEAEKFVRRGTVEEGRRITNLKAEQTKLVRLVRKAERTQTEADKHAAIEQRDKVRALKREDT